jgi:hypothetical protein
VRGGGHGEPCGRDVGGFLLCFADAGGPD